jgi:hypothetical protein
METYRISTGPAIALAWSVLDSRPGGRWHWPTSGFAV